MTDAQRLGGGGDAHAQANAQVALGLAALRLEDRAEARQALEAAIELEPQNAFALRSLGSLLVIAGALAAGSQRFRQALAVVSDDLITTCSCLRGWSSSASWRCSARWPPLARAACRSMSPAPPAASRPCQAAGAIWLWPA